MSCYIPSEKQFQAMAYFIIRNVNNNKKEVEKDIQVLINACFKSFYFRYKEDSKSKPYKFIFKKENTMIVSAEQFLIFCTNLDYKKFNPEYKLRDIKDITFRLNGLTKKELELLSGNSY